MVKEDLDLNVRYAKNMIRGLDWNRFAHSLIGMEPEVVHPHAGLTTSDCNFPVLCKLSESAIESEAGIYKSNGSATLRGYLPPFRPLCIPYPLRGLGLLSQRPIQAKSQSHVTAYFCQVHSLKIN
jgi:hypothetical protein